MGKDIACIIIIIGAPLAIGLFIVLNMYNDRLDKGSLTISFDQFISLYRINPKSWDLNTDYIRYWCAKRTTDNNYIIGYEYKTIEFATIIDKFKYKRWVKKETKRKEDIQRDQEITELIAEWQKDINNAQKANIQRTKELMRKNEEDAKKYGGI